MKKIACLVVSLALVLSLCGCITIITEPELNVENEKKLDGDVFVLCEAGGEWVNISEAPSFGSCTWEPGFMTARVLQVNCVGLVAINWSIRSGSVGGFGALGDVIDVYVRTGNPIFPVSSDEVDSWTCLGNLNDVLEFGSGTLLPEESEYLAVALKMHTDADSTYYGMSLGAAVDFSVFITQLESENDSFGNQYDADVNE